MKDKRRDLIDQLEELTRQDTCVAFSGGVDSSLLLMLMTEKARHHGTTVYAVTFDTVLHPRGDATIARAVANEAQAVHQVLKIDELDQPEIRNNDKRRCYYCKKALFQQLITFSSEKGAKAVVEGTNFDDLSVYRPGLDAVQELGVYSPLAKAKLTKAEVREWAKEIGLSVAERPSAPCMATRLPYGTPIESVLLGKIEAGESYLHSIGFDIVRLRVHGEIARLEVSVDQFAELLVRKDEIIAELKRIGFFYITLDLEGFRSGSMDEVVGDK